MSARNYAIEKHWGQMYGDKPYSYHLDQVANKIKSIEIRYNKNLLIEVAYLHDVLEDTKVTYKELKQAFGVDIAGAVYALTTSDIPLRNNLLCNHDAMKVKLVDRYCNVKSCIKDNKLHLLEKYKKQKDLFQNGDFNETGFIEVYKNLKYMLKTNKLI